MEEENTKVLSAVAHVNGFTHTRPEGDIPKCSVCEDERLTPAVKVCPTCKIRYCQDCLESFHPSKGALKTHKLMSVQDYISRMRPVPAAQPKNGPQPSAISDVDLQITPLPRDFEMRSFLLTLSKDLQVDDFRGFKYLVKGLGGIGFADIEACKDVLDLFELLEKKACLTMKNIVVLQILIWFTGRNDLYNRMVEFACRNKDLIHISSAPPAGNGYQNVKLHVNGDISMDRLGEIRSAAARWLCIPERYIIVAGLEPTGSWFVTLSIPTIGVKRLAQVFTLYRDWLLERDIDTIEINGDVLDLANCAESQNMAKTTSELCSRCSRTCVPFSERVFFWHVGHGPVCQDCLLLPELTNSQLPLYQIDRNCIEEDIREYMAHDKPRLFLRQLENEIDFNDFTGFKYVLKDGYGGDNGSTRDIFRRLIEEGVLMDDNMLILEELIWFAGREDLYYKILNFACESKGISQATRHQNLRNEASENEMVTIYLSHVLENESVADIRAALSRWMCIPIIAMKTQKSPLPSSRSLDLEIPKISLEKLQGVLELHRDWLERQSITAVRTSGEVFYEKELPPPDPLSAHPAAPSSSTPMGEDLQGQCKPAKIIEFYSRGGVVSLQDATPPKLNFIKTKGSQLEISPDGLMVECKEQAESDDYAEAWTDGHLLKGKLFWIIEVDVQFNSPDSVFRCLIGVVQEECSLWGMLGRTSWCVDMEYRVDQFISLSPHGYGIEPSYRDWVAHKGSHKICVVLDCSAKTLSFTDVSQKYVMLSLKGVNVLKPLTPAIQFKCNGGKISAKVRLISLDRI